MELVLGDSVLTITIVFLATILLSIHKLRGVKYIDHPVEALN